ncbi:hypothetical protein PIB30_108596 [Stylosanthes scabra]|uniref:Uncharacterized protein n=1 Tax=Stylosanthes scabra TaxID=79078 RepID=A0ABU6S124_9FABA|nr:hypothetical protein [Stylosanthes scabra]
MQSRFSVMAENTVEFEIERVDSKDVRVDSRQEKTKTKKTLSVKSRLQTFRVDSCINNTKTESTLGRTESILPNPEWTFRRAYVSESTLMDPSRLLCQQNGGNEH